jgi:hypothetical protein
MKKPLYLAMACLLPALTLSLAQAGSYSDESQPELMSKMSNSSVALGVAYNQTAGSTLSTLTYLRDSLIASIGFTYKKVDPTDADDYSITYVPLSLGVLKPVSDKVSYSLGVGGMYGANSQDNGSDPYVYGPEVGLYYFPVDHLMTSVTLMPYAKERDHDGEMEDELFREGSIGMSYVF